MSVTNFFPSLIVLRQVTISNNSNFTELISVVLLLDGYKTYGEGAHKKLIEYLQTKNIGFNEYEILLMHEKKIFDIFNHNLLSDNKLF